MYFKVGRNDCIILYTVDASMVRTECLCPSQCWNPIAQVMVLGHGAFGRCLGRKGGWDQCPYTRDPSKLFSPSHHVKMQREVWDQEESFHSMMLAPSSEAFSIQNYKKYISVVYKLANPWYLVVTT